MATLRKLDLQDERVRVEARFEESGSIFQGTKNGRCLGFNIELSLQTMADKAEIEQLIRQAHQMCFTQDVLTNQAPVRITQRINGALIDVPLSDEENGNL